MLQAIFFARYLTTNQITSLFYNSANRASTRLNQLKKKGYVSGRLVYTKKPAEGYPGKRETVWHLSKEAFEMVAGDLEIDDDDYTPKQLGEKRTRDCLKANEVFVVAKAAPRGRARRVPELGVAPRKKSLRLLLVPGRSTTPPPRCPGAVLRPPVHHRAPDQRVARHPGGDLR